MSFNYFQKIEQSTYSVSIENATIINYKGDKETISLLQNGTAFAITEKKLLTAQHVLALKTENNIVKLYNTTYQKVVLAKIIFEDVEKDLALLEVIGDQKLTSLPIGTELPLMGDMVGWGGYPRLIGERVHLRFRLGSGLIASHSYQEKTSEFFEVNGNFNPALSGGPLFHFSDKKVIGVVIASAGSPDLILDYLRDYKKYLQLLTFFSDFGAGRSISTQISFTYQDSKDINIFLFKELGFKEREIKSVNKEKGHYSMQVTLSEPITIALNLLNKMINLLEKSARNTYQMGIGIASGGIGLQQFLSKNDLDYLLD